MLECHHVTGEYVYLLKVVVRNRKELEHLLMEELTPIPGVAHIHTSLVLNEIKAGNYMIEEDGTVVLTDENGEPKTDNVGKVITFKDHVHGIASSYFEKATDDKRKAPGGKTTPPKPGAIEVPKDDNEFARKMGELKTPEERAELSRLYRESKQ